MEAQDVFISTVKNLFRKVDPTEATAVEEDISFSGAIPAVDAPSLEISKARTGQ